MGLDKGELGADDFGHGNDVLVPACGLGVDWGQPDELLTVRLSGERTQLAFF